MNNDETSNAGAMTPGPWEVESDGSTIAMGGQCVIVSPAPDGASRATEKANARAIAATPILIETLRQIATGTLQGSPDVNLQRRGMMALANAALDVAGMTP